MGAAGGRRTVVRAVLELGEQRHAEVREPQVHELKKEAPNMLVNLL